MAGFRLSTRRQMRLVGRPGGASDERLYWWRPTFYRLPDGGLQAEAANWTSHGFCEELAARAQWLW